MIVVMCLFDLIRFFVSNDLGIALYMHIYRDKVSAAILHLCKRAIRKTKEPCLDWLRLLPLYHFMSGSCEPFASLEYNPDKIQFNSRAKLFGYDEIQWKPLSGYGGMLYNR